MLKLAGFDIFDTLVADFKIIFERDPAARSGLEVLFCYPGFQALVCHRFAHWLFGLGLPLIPRLISHLARFLTGVEIHPGATIGKSVFIDHGMGVVIGETAIIGNGALIYQGVTLGGTGKETGKRHPTLGENVVVGAGAKVLGNLLIGNNVRIGAGSVVLRDVPSDCTVVGIPGRVVYRSGEKTEPLEHGRLPDSEAQVIRALVDRIESLELQLQVVQSRQSIAACYAMAAADCSVGARMGLTHPELADLGPSRGLDINAVSNPGINRLDLDPDLLSCRLCDKAINEFLDGGAGI
jgi:serine O-acetyltransferase